MDRAAQEQFSDRRSVVYLWGACFDSSLVLLISTDFKISKLLMSCKVRSVSFNLSRFPSFPYGVHRWMAPPNDTQKVTFLCPEYDCFPSHCHNIKGNIVRGTEEYPEPIQDMWTPHAV
jgi:hypothetical protein